MEQERCYEVGEIEESPATDPRVFAHAVARGLHRQHPRGDLQRVPRRIDDRHSAVTDAGPTRHFEFESMKRVEGVLDPDRRT